ncbi:FkbM family methyltransferase [Synergistaceae bacterium OttesenSCG-928-I11]|nr:FkbM family methyltransferase [Synergistaceae bacterium OttesenSCG-928-I11]
MKKQFIFYGAGSYAKSVIDSHIAMDIVPACFADKDEKKHHTKIKTQNGSEYEILPLREAITRFPDFVLIVMVEPSLFAGVCYDLIENAGIMPELIGPPLFYNQPAFRGSSNNFSELQNKLADSAVKKIEIFQDCTDITVDALGDNQIFKMRMDDIGGSTMGILEEKQCEADEMRMQHRILSMFSRDSIIFDVGANVGLYSLCYKTWFPEMTVYAFEPLPLTYSFLKENLALNKMDGVVANNFGFFDEEKRVEFHFYRYTSGASSIQNIRKLGESAFEKVECSVTTLDSYVDKKNAHVDFIKCDVEGSELYVYKGGIQTLKRDKPVVFSEIVHSAAFGYSHNDVVSLFKDLGYVCHVIENDRLKAIETITEDERATNFIFIHSSKLEMFESIICD